MTVSVDKKIIHIGWETAASIILFLVVTMWGGGAWMSKYLEKQDYIYRSMVRQNRKDTTQSDFNNQVKLSLYFLNAGHHNDSVRISMLEGSPRYRNYTEKRGPNGRIQFNPVKK